MKPNRFDWQQLTRKAQRFRKLIEAPPTATTMKYKKQVYGKQLSPSNDRGLSRLTFFKQRLVTDANS